MDLPVGSVVTIGVVVGGTVVVSFSEMKSKQDKITNGQ
jgi:hypothetical protein